MTSVSKHAPQEEQARAEQSRRILQQVECESQTFAESSVARSMEKRLFDTPDDDPIERWGRIIGRSLGFAFLLYLAYHLITTYVLT